MEKSCKLKNTYQKRSVNPNYNCNSNYNCILTFNLETRIEEHSTNSQNSQNIKLQANSFNMNCQSKKRKREREKNIIRNQNGNERKSGDETNFRAIFIYRKPPLAILYTQSRS